MKKWLTADCNQLLLLQPCIDDWLPAGHLARFVVDVGEQLDLAPIPATPRSFWRCSSTATRPA